MPNETNYALYLKTLADQISEIEMSFEELLFAVSEEINRVMKEDGVSKSELATRMGVSRPYVTKLLNGSANVSLQTLAKVSVALGSKTYITIRPKNWMIIAVSPSNERIDADRRNRYEGFKEVEGQVYANASNS